MREKTDAQILAPAIKLLEQRVSEEQQRARILLSFLNTLRVEAGLCPRLPRCASVSSHDA